MNIVEDFTIDGEQRLAEFQDQLDNALNHSTLREPITKQGNGTYHISLRCDFDDVICLERLIEKWSEEDKLIRQSTPKVTLIQSILDRFKFSTS